MNKLKTLFLVLFISVFYGALFAQNNPVSFQELQKKYNEYFNLHRETVYLHLNKTTLLKGESLWFAAYAYKTPLHKIDTTLTNLHVNVYTNEGKLLAAKTIFMNNGYGSGNFLLDEKVFKPGEYTLTASTKYMENFEEDLTFTQRFQILGTDENTKQITEKYDLHILAEGGHLLANSSNSIGVKLIDANGKGVYFNNGKILDSKNKVISTFHSNDFGMAKITFTPILSENYKIVLNTENDDIVEKIIPKAEAKGINMTVNNLLSKQIILSIKTNNVTANSIKDQKFTLLIHKKEFMKAFEISFPDDSLENLIALNREELYPGVNTFTIFNENFEPLLERLIYNPETEDPINLNATLNKNRGDSLFINLNSVSNLKENNLSISVLPYKTKAYNPKNNIFSALYIQPYIKGNIDNGAYYFSHKVEKRKRDYDLDLLLLTQGWSKYEWYRIFNNPPSEFYSAENGFTVQGKLLNRNEDRETKLLVTIPNSPANGILNIKDDNSIMLDKMFINDSTQVNFSLFNDRNKKFNTPKLYLTVLPPKDMKDQKKYTLRDKLEYNTNAKDISQISTQSIPDNFLINTTQLDTVVLKGVNKKTESQIIEHGAFVSEEIFPDVPENSQEFLSTYLQSHGFNVDINFVVTSRRNSSFSSAGRGLQPLIYLDGIPLDSDLQSIYLRDLRISDIKSISINKSGGGFGGNAGGGVIYVNSRKTRKNYIKEVNVYKYMMSNGFAPKKKFYAPKYVSYTSDIFSQYGVIDWFSDIKLNENGFASFKIQNTLQSKVKLFIEGMTIDGKLLSQEIDINIK